MVIGRVSIGHNDNIITLSDSIISNFRTDIYVVDISVISNVY